MLVIEHLDAQQGPTVRATVRGRARAVVTTDDGLALVGLPVAVAVSTMKAVAFDASVRRERNAMTTVVQLRAPILQVACIKEVGSLAVTVGFRSTGGRTVLG